MMMAAAPASANPSRLWQQPNLIALGVVVMALALVWAVLAIRPDNENKNETNVQNAKTEPNSQQRPAAAQLELLKMVHSHRDTRLLIEGLVKNISSDTLKNLTAVAIFYDDDESFLTSDVGQLAFNMLLPEEKAPFRIWTLDDHHMRRFEVNFRDDRGAPLQLADHRESPHDYINLPSSAQKEHKKEGEEHDHEVHK